ncbi:hypothetical protein LROSL1_2320 [Furfurilactobacillus rossiae]|nr:lanthionine synthetase LanC family protein [Furfurilactobacillus rossiae]QLE65121.1 hypothetical protein LROSL1_2320 [Furfurilactobacillus rossiae]
MNISLCYGLTGVAYSLKLANKVLQSMGSFMVQFDDLYSKLTAAQIEQTELGIKKRGLFEKDYDLIQGLSSCLGYLTQFGNSKKDTDNVRRIGQLFDWLFDFSNQKIPNSTISGNHIIDSARRNYYKNGYVNLGISHGLAGPLAALSTVGRTGALQRGLSFYEEIFEQNKRIEAPWSGEASVSAIEQKKFKTENLERSGWCYGNPGIARAVFMASRKQHNSAMERVATDYFSTLKQLDFSELKLESPTVCHGISGLLLILNAMTRETHSTVLNDFKQQIGLRLLSKANFDNKLLFKEYDYVFKEKKYSHAQYFDDLGILNGSGGIILTLMSLNAPARLDWERILLVS